MTPRDTTEMREWLEGFINTEGQIMSAAKLSDLQVVEKIEELYDGGVEKFLKDGEDLNFSFDPPDDIIDVTDESNNQVEGDK